MMFMSMIDEGSCCVAFESVAQCGDTSYAEPGEKPSDFTWSSGLVSIQLLVSVGGVLPSCDRFPD